MLKKLIIIIRDFSRQMGRQNIPAFASSTAFFLFLSIIPMLIVICSIIPYTPLTEENLVMAVSEITPEAVEPLIENLISEIYDKSAGVLSLALIVTLWTAGKGVLALMRGLNAINDVFEERNYIIVRGIAIWIEKY